MSYVGNTNTTQAFTPAVDYFSGDGSTVAFTLSRPVASTAQVQAVVNNVPQNPTDAFTVLNNTITFTSAPSSGTNNIYVQYTSPITQVIQPGQGTVTSNSFGLITDFTTTGNTVLGNASTDTLNVGNGGLVKDASGNVGIGTSSPNQKLAIAAGSGAGAAIEMAGNGNTLGTTSFYVGQGSGGDAYVYQRNATQPLVFGTNNTERMRIDSSGNLGLGVTPSAWTSNKALQIGTYAAIEDNSGGGGGIALFGNAYEYSSGAYKYLQSYYATLYRTYAGQHQWFTAPSGTAGNAISFTQAMTLDSSGNLLVGTTTQLYANTSRLSVKAVNLQYGATISSINAGYQTLTVINEDVGGTRYFTEFRLNANGATQVGSITSSGSTTAYNTTSDYRLKENIAPMTGALAKVAALKPVTYRWKETGELDQGFIAHELQEVLPGAVTGEKDGVDPEGNPRYQGIDTSFLVATLTAAIQELKAINDAQAETITALTARVTALESK